MRIPVLGFDERRVAVSICLAMPPAQAAAALNMDPNDYEVVRRYVMAAYGFDSPTEFAINVNAAVRDAYQAGFSNSPQEPQDV